MKLRYFVNESMMMQGGGMMLRSTLFRTLPGMDA